MVNSKKYERRNLSIRTSIKLVISVVISFLAVALILSSSTFTVYALPPEEGFSNSGTCGDITKNPRTGNNSQSCCWTERVPGKLPPNNKETYCQTCEFTAAGTDCKPKQPQLRPSARGASPEEGVLEQPPTPQPVGPAAPQQGGGVLQQTPSTDQGTQPPKSGDTVAPKEGGVVSNDQNPPKNKDTNPPTNDQRTRSGDNGSSNNK